MKLRNILALMMLPVVCCVLLLAEDFTVQPKKKNAPRTAVSKEQCAQTGGDILTEMPNILELLACLQRKVLCMEQDLLEGNKQGFFFRASKEQLNEYHKTLELIHDELTRGQQILATQIRQLDVLQKNMKP